MGLGRGSIEEVGRSIPASSGGGSDEVVPRLYCRDSGGLGSSGRPEDEIFLS